MTHDQRYGYDRLVQRWAAATGGLRASAGQQRQPLVFGGVATNLATREGSSATKDLAELTLFSLSFLSIFFVRNQREFPPVL
ncbi:hypothetical protein NL676_020433 [Syzygium grande]|nr:hypothetical protein NL676_020433 [Syzygium grande]